ncbi:MAG: FmdB family zinc ribbon protein [Anaerolineaceae bacterium]
MPIYTYRCDNCGVQFDQKQSFSDQILKVCPECGKKSLYKIYTPVGIVFKGSGFYATDHRSPSGQSNSKSHSEEKSSSSNHQENTKTETAPSSNSTSDTTN